MRKQHLAGKFAISTVSLVGLLLSNSIFSADLSGNGRRANEVGSMGPVPKAACGPSDRTESGLQGRTTSQERASGDSEAATTAISSSLAGSAERGPFLRTGLRTMVTAPIWRRKMTRSKRTRA